MLKQKPFYYAEKSGYFLLPLYRKIFGFFANVVQGSSSGYTKRIFFFFLHHAWFPTLFVFHIWIKIPIESDKKEGRGKTFTDYFKKFVYLNFKELPATCSVILPGSYGKDLSNHHGDFVYR